MDIELICSAIDKLNSYYPLCIMFQLFHINYDHFSCLVLGATIYSVLTDIDPVDIVDWHSRRSSANPSWAALNPKVSAYDYSS